LTDTPADPKPSSDELLVDLVREALICLRLERDTRANLGGKIVGLREHGAVIFADFADASGTLQLKIDRSVAPESHEVMRGLSVGALVKVDGKMGVSSRRKTPTLEVETLAPVSSPNATAITVNQIELAGGRVFLARLRRRAEDFFLQRSFVQIEPSLISTRWDDAGIEPLKVQYEGFGMPTYLSPSPLPQLRSLLEASGGDAAFAVGRCFATTYRDETSSAESVVLVALVGATSATSLTGVLEDALHHVLGDELTAPAEFEHVRENGWEHRSPIWPPPATAKDVSVPTIQTFRLDEISTVRTLSFAPAKVIRACLPGRSTIAEASYVPNKPTSGEGTIVLHLERMVPLLRDIPLYQLQDLQRGASQ